jgi:hypothetical protein
MSDPSAAYDRLRVETAEMLKLDVANLSLVEGLQLDLVSMLRLEVDGLQGAVLAGEQVDLGRLSTALGMLRQLLPEKSLVASPAAAPETRFGTNHRERLRQLIEKTLMAADVAEADRLADAMRREEAIQAQAAGAPVEAPPAPAPAAPAPQPGNVIPLDATMRANTNLPPAHYLREGQPREAWRDFYDGRVTGPPPWPLPQR